MSLARDECRVVPPFVVVLKKLFL